MAATNPNPKPRLLTGDRPTGPLHLGHLLGSLQSRVAMQDSHECFIIVADLHTLTTRPQREHVGRLPRHVRAVALDLLSAGIDPEKIMARSHPILPLQAGRPQRERILDVARMVLFLASDESGSCTGGDFPVEGGNTAGKIVRGAPGA